MDRRKFLIGSGSVLAAAAGLSGTGNSAQAKGIPDILRQSSANNKPIITQSNDLTAYQGPWTDTTLRHLLRRAMFGVPLSQFQAAQSLGSMSAVVDKLLDDTAPLPDLLTNAPQGQTPFGTVVPIDKTNPDQVFATEDAYNLERARQSVLVNWWLDLIIKENLSIRERMTLFWSNHFVVGSDVVVPAPYLYYYNLLLRSHALGNMKTFVTDITRNPAMIQYLNCDENYDGLIPSTQIQGGLHINENYARELCELFTLGITDPVSGMPNYSESDVQQAAKALTGWSYNSFEPGGFMSPSGVDSYFPSSHNTDQKIFLGQTGNWTWSDIIDIIFNYKGPTGSNQAGFNAAYWFCRKIYMEFVYYVPNTGVVTAMANLMVKNNFDIKPVLEALLQSDHFYSDNVQNSQIKSPINFIAGMIREFNLDYGALDLTDPPFNSIMMGLHTYNNLNPSLTFLTLTTAGTGLGQMLLDPPNVRGWLGGRSWVSTGTFDQRQQFSHDALISPVLFDGTTTNESILLAFSDPTKWIQSTPNFANMKSNEVAAAASQIILNRELGPIEAGVLYQVLNQLQLPESDFYYKDQYIANFAIALAQLPEYQLT